MFWYIYKIELKINVFIQFLKEIPLENHMIYFSHIKQPCIFPWWSWKIHYFTETNVTFNCNKMSRCKVLTPITMFLFILFQFNNILPWYTICSSFMAFLFSSSTINMGPVIFITMTTLISSPLPQEFYWPQTLLLLFIG